MSNRLIVDGIAKLMLQGNLLVIRWFDSSQLGAERNDWILRYAALDRSCELNFRFPIPAKRAFTGGPCWTFCHKYWSVSAFLVFILVRKSLHVIGSAAI